MTVKRELVNLFFSQRPANGDSLSAMGHVLKTERLRRGHTAKAAAEAVGVTPAYISQLESGKKVNPTIRVINEYAEFLETDILDIILRMKVTEMPDQKRLDALISGIEETLQTLKAIRKLEGENNNEQV